MTNIAFISDIHGNLHALEAVLADIESQEIGETICLGDLVGYGGSPGECVGLIRARGIACAQGNQDLMVAGGDLSEASAEVQASIEWTRRALSTEAIDWLGSLPPTLLSDEFEAVHASLHEPQKWRYILNSSEAALSFAHQKRHVCFVGHTHQPAIWVKGRETMLPITSLEDVLPGRQQIVTVGAVGQPRDRDERACYAIYRPQDRDVWWRRVNFDIAAAQATIINAGLPSKHAMRLERGK